MLLSYHLVKRKRIWVPLVTAAIVALTLAAYSGLPDRPFAADDYQWLLNVHGLGAGAVLRTAFDPQGQHFYRPLVWLLFWAQYQVFGLAPWGYHAVSLALHLASAGLLGALAWRLGSGVWGALLAIGLAALHPAPFEAVVWAAAQSELLAALLLLGMLHLAFRRPPGFAGSLRVTAALGLALLAKESAVIGLGMLLLLDWREPGIGGQAPASLRSRPADVCRTGHVSRFTLYGLPLLLTAAYLLLQLLVEQRNYLLHGAYGLGPQLVLNPLRSLALLIAPLPGAEQADAPWLLPLGMGAALGLLALFARGPWNARCLVLGLLLTLLPTAPFASPPDSRYLYLPALAAGLLVALAPGAGYRLHVLAFGQGGAAGRQAERGTDRRFETTPATPTARRILPALVTLACLLAAACVIEISARERRFAAANGPGGSLWQVTSSVVCAAGGRPGRVIVVDPPLAASHAEAIVRLACGPGVRPKIVRRDQLAQALGRRSAVVSFSHGRAVVERWT